jgi:hypothetical protein
MGKAALSVIASFEGTRARHPEAREPQTIPQKTIPRNHPSDPPQPTRLQRPTPQRLPVPPAHHSYHLLAGVWLCTNLCGYGITSNGTKSLPESGNHLAKYKKSTFLVFPRIFTKSAPPIGEIIWQNIKNSIFGNVTKIVQLIIFNTKTNDIKKSGNVANFVLVFHAFPCL